MFIVIAYDICDKRTLRRVMKLVESYGVRRQKSVFECDLDERRFVELRGRISALIDPEEDRVCYYHLCAACRERISALIDPEEDRVCYYHLCAACRERIEGLTEHEHPVPRKGGFTLV